jgi:hypothetical protein
MIYNFNRKKQYRRSLKDLPVMDDYRVESIDDPQMVEVEYSSPTEEPIIKKKYMGKYKYFSLVRGLTHQVNKEEIEGYDPERIITKDMVMNEGRGIFQSKELLVIDHKISISYGYRNNIPANHIAHISNLRYIPSKTNASKNSTNYIDDINYWIIKNM